MSRAKAPFVSLIIPTRERATYLGHALATCLANPDDDVEIIVVDNASTDCTADVVGRVSDPRLRYVRGERRVSMRDNFERGLLHATGEFVGFLGDDDGIFPFTVSEIRRIAAMFPQAQAIAAARAFYWWPDLQAARRNMALLPRRAGVELRHSGEELKKLLRTSNYYDLPCIYHGFVKRSMLTELSQRHGRFFLSSNVDIYSAVAVSAQDVAFAFSEAPLFINGGSSRSNGASHFGGGATQEKQNWTIEDELGCLPGFEGFKTVASLIVESALRFTAAYPEHQLFNLLTKAAVEQSLSEEARLRGREAAATNGAMFAQAGLAAPSNRGAAPSRWSATGRKLRSLARSRPIDFTGTSVVNVEDAATSLADDLSHGRTSFFHDPIGQVRTATRMAASRS